MKRRSRTSTTRIRGRHHTKEFTVIGWAFVVVGVVAAAVGGLYLIAYVAAEIQRALPV